MAHIIAMPHHRNPSSFDQVIEDLIADHREKNKNSPSDAITYWRVLSKMINTLIEEPWFDVSFIFKLLLYIIKDLNFNKKSIYK